MNIDLSFLAHAPSAKQWQRIHIKHHHGLVLPLFSLHSSQSFGIGEFPDLLPMIDWYSRTGLSVIQLLPLNDNGLDSSPYNALSAFALNPIHLGLSSLPYLEDYPILQEELKTIPKLPHYHWVDYSHTRQHKERFLRHYFQLTQNRILISQAYQDFEQRAKWLEGFTIFKTLKEFHQWHSWSSWPSEQQTPSSHLFQQVKEQYPEEVKWHCFLQFLCDQQMHRVKEYATSRQVLLMGDIPILISPDSADVWLHRHLFDLNATAGAPPDVFSSEGQNWGFPLYNWAQMENQGYAWWIDRLKWASQYYALYRLDHIAGFFRIWAIPLGRKSKEGHFIPEDPTIWIHHGQRILLTMLAHCDMLPIGEDLGIIPLEIRSCLEALGICGTRVMRWERDWKQEGQFIPIDKYNLVSMTTVSTHDSETLQLWWQNNPADVKIFTDFKGWSHHSILSRLYHKEILWDSHHSNSLFHINPLQEYLALIPGLTWNNLEYERINQPGIHIASNWCYRFKPSVEELIQHPTLTRLLQEIIL